MTEQLRESLSAMMDNEATDFEVRQILKQASDSTEVSEQFKRYTAARAAMHDTAAWTGIDISGRVAAAIDDEASTGSGWSWMKPAGGFAVAASVAAVVVFATQGLNSLGGNASPVQVAQVAPVTSTPLPAVTQRQNARTVATTRYTINDQASGAASQALLQQRLSQYMQIHAKHASMNGSQGAVPLARVANYRVEQ
ncbi:MAG: sigma-E factor negative regulatory protein [Pseudomonadota bacterium]